MTNMPEISYLELGTEFEQEVKSKQLAIRKAKNLNECEGKRGTSKMVTGSWDSMSHEEGVLNIVLGAQFEHYPGCINIPELHPENLEYFSARYKSREPYNQYLSKAITYEDEWSGGFTKIYDVRRANRTQAMQLSVRKPYDVWWVAADKYYRAAPFESEAVKAKLYAEVVSARKEFQTLRQWRSEGYNLNIYVPQGILKSTFSDEEDVEASFIRRNAFVPEEVLWTTLNYDVSVWPWARHIPFKIDLHC